MPLQIIDCEQGTPEWFAARAGIPTASEFSTVMASGRGGGESKTRATYMKKLVGEILTGRVEEGYSNSHMERGKVMESEARNAYALLTDTEPMAVGFIRNGRKGASPDSMIGETGLLEIKTKLPHLLLDEILRDDFPPEHMAQCQGQLWVAEREWLDIQLYWPGIEAPIKRIHRDETYIMKMSKAVNEFNEELDDLLARVRARLGTQREAA
jgi:hypothetical protein